MKTSNFSPLVLVNRNSDEWLRMWDALAQLKLNCSLPDPSIADNFGETWEYMETVETRFLWFGKRYVHRFRHRCHPITNGRIVINIQAEKTFCPDNANYHDFG